MLSFDFFGFVGYCKYLLQERYNEYLPGTVDFCFSISCLVTTVCTIWSASKGMVDTKTLSSSFAISVSVLCIVNSSSSAWCLIPSRCTISRFDSDSLRGHQVSSSEVSDSVNIHLKASRSVLMVIRLSSRYVPTNNMVHTTARHSPCIFASFRSLSLSVPDPYSTSLSCLSVCF